MIPNRSDVILVPLALVLVLLGVAPAAADGFEFRPWLDRDGETLPFRSDEELVDFLRNARVVSFKQLSTGSNNPYRLDLEHDGVAARAIFRDVDVTRRNGSSARERHFPSFRDSYAYEVAAYEMSRLLGLDNVPPATLYEWRGVQGSLQLWVERAQSEGERMTKGEDPADPSSWHIQRTSMRVFDNLIYNFDRNHGNQLLDERGKLWFIDHTRSFKAQSSLPAKQEILVVDTELWNRLRNLDMDIVEERLSHLLDLPQMDALGKRHKALLKHIDRMIEQRGSQQVLLVARGDDVLRGTGH